MIFISLKNSNTSISMRHNLSVHVVLISYVQLSWDKHAIISEYFWPFGLPSWLIVKPDNTDWCCSRVGSLISSSIKHSNWWIKQQQQPVINDLITLKFRVYSQPGTKLLVVRSLNDSLSELHHMFSCNGLLCHGLCHISQTKCLSQRWINLNSFWNVAMALSEVEKS